MCNLTDPSLTESEHQSRGSQQVSSTRHTSLSAPLWRALPACRVRLCGHVASLACGLGVSAITIVHLCTLTAHSRSAASSASVRARVRREVTMASLSLGFTILAFYLTVTGFKNVWRSMRAAAERISTRISTRIFPRGPMSHAGGHSEAVSAAAHGSGRRVAPAPQVCLRGQLWCLCGRIWETASETAVSIYAAVPQAAALRWNV